MVRSDLALPAPPPSDAVVLFDGKSLENWRAQDGSPSQWIVRDGYMESVKGSGYIYTRRTFGDIQLHVEFASPAKPEGDSQGRGNSGVFLMGLYEIQVLDSWQNRTYADGQAGSIYGQYPPLTNAARPPGEWQSYDIVFRRPRFRRDGSVERPARFTVFHNGVLVQDNVEARGPTSWLQNFPYESHPDRLPLAFQDHGNPVRYRNIWLRELNESTPSGPAEADPRPVITMPPADLERYVGDYTEDSSGKRLVRISRAGDRLRAAFYELPPLDLVIHSPTEFSLRWTAADLLFDLDGSGRATAVAFHIGGEIRRGTRAQ
jgi:hypothetical protein